MIGFSRENSDRIGFVTSCLFYESIDIGELKQWVIHILENHEQAPRYLIDLLDFEPPLANIFKTIGFVPHWIFAEESKEALFGIAFRRGRFPHECPITRDQAVELLKRHSEIEAAFRAEFPFLVW